SRSRRSGDPSAYARASLRPRTTPPAAVILALAVAAPMIAPEVSIDPIWVAGAALAASCPSSNNAVIFAVQHKIYEARASATVLISTALSLVTIATIAALVTR
ncbi:MAG: hypothetical protein AAFW46_07220, partial [Pseudomonadota bacterium]